MKRTLMFSILVLATVVVGTTSASARQGVTNRLSGRRVPTQVALARPGVAVPRPDEDMRGAERWFVKQRAYPRKRIAAAAVARARHQASQLASTSTLAATIPAGAWTEIGPRPISESNLPDVYAGPLPVAGRVESLATVPGSSSTAYAAAEEGGVWKTTDGGSTWSPIFDNQPTLTIGSVSVDPNATGTVYVGTGAPGFSGGAYYGAGLFRSLSGGGSWSKIGGTRFDGCSLPDVQVKPGDSNTILVAVKPATVSGSSDCTPRAGVWRTTDGGTNWTNVLPGTATDLAVAPGGGSVWYAGIYGSGVWKSLDSGATWSQLAGGLPSGGSVGRTMVAVAPSNASRVYAFIENAFTDEVLKLMTSTDGGGNWTSVATPPDLCGVPGEGGQCFHAMALLVDPSVATTFYAGGVTLYRFTSVGAARARIGYGTTGIHVDFHALAFDASSRLWVGNDGGVYRTGDGGQTFADLNQTLGITQFYPGTSGSLAGDLIGGTQDNGTLEHTLGASGWSMMAGGDGGETAEDPNNTDIRYTTLPFAAAVERSVDGGRTWKDASTGISDTDPIEYIFPLEMDPNNASRLLTATDRVWQTTNAAGSWAAISPAFRSTISALGIAPSDSQVLYAGLSNGSLRATIDGGANWRARSFGLPGRYVTEIDVDPNNSSDAYVSVSGFGTGHVFHTTTLGGSWTDVSGNLPNAPVNALAVDRRSSPATLFAGTDVGVFASGDGGSTWARVGTGLPHTIVNDVRLDLQADRLIAATYGRGMFSIPLDKSSSADLRVTELSSPGSTTTGSNITYSITVTNLGPSATSAWLADDLTQYVSYVSSTPSQGSCASHRTVICDLGSIASGSTATASVVVRASAGGSVVNKVRVAGAVNDPTQGNNSATATTAVTLGSGCTITGTVGSDVLFGTPGNDRICGLGGSDTLIGLAGNDVLDGGAGFDWVEYFHSYSPVVVNLKNGTATGNGTDTLVGLEAIDGSYGNDQLTGTSGGNTFIGEAGNDTITGGGGSGFDYVSYAYANYGVNVNLATGSATGGDDVDTLSQIGGVFGSDFNDVLTGDGTQNDLWGEAGADQITGGGCTGCVDFASYADVSGTVGITVDLATGAVSGAAGADHLSGIRGIFATNAADTLTGDSGGDSFYGLGGADTIDGGAGEDAVSYFESGAGVSANLATGAVSGGEGGDHLTSIEDLDGSVFGDNFTGSSAANVILGEDGSDTISAVDGTSGNDYVDGGPNTDACSADPGDTVLNCP